KSSQRAFGFRRRGARQRCFMSDPPPSVRFEKHRPYPKKRPQSMQCEQTHPPSSVDRILMWVVAGFRDLMRDIMDSDDAVEHDGYDKEEQEQCEVVQERVIHRRLASGFVSQPGENLIALQPT